MTTTTQPATTLTFGGILRSELIKLRTLRSTIWCYAIAVFFTVALGLLITSVSAFEGDPLPTTIQQATAAQFITVGVGFSQLVVVVLGALVITGEYGTGMIRTTMAAVPERLPALFGKALVFGVVTFVLSLAAIALTTALTAPLMPKAGVTPDFGDGALLLTLLGAPAYLALVGVFAFALGAIIRNSAGGIAAALGAILVLPSLVSIFSSITQATWAYNLNQFLPSTAGERMLSYPVDAGARVDSGLEGGLITLEPWQGGLVLVAWVVVLLGIAAFAVKRRDV